MGEFKLNNKRKKVKLPFTVPNGYFDHFAEELMEQLSHQEPVMPKKIILWKRVLPWIYVAAMLAGAAFLFNYVTDPGNKSGTMSVYDVIRCDHSSIKKALSDMSEDEYFEIMEDHATSVSYHQTLLTDLYY